MSKRKICVVTGTRAEYGLLYWLMREIQEDQDLQLQIVATGMHLSPEFGSTYRIIDQDGFNIDEKVEMLLSSDTPVGIATSMGVATIGFANAFERLKPDIVVVLGDRFEILACAQAAMVARIPIAHLHGGERTEGVIDEAIRHAVTKMAHLHFVAADEYRKRVIQLGERPERVFNVGAIGVDQIKNLHLLNKKEFENSIQFELGPVNFLVTYHPVTLNKEGSECYVHEIFTALDEFPDAKIIFTKPNSDTDGRVISRMIDEYVHRNSQRAAAYTSLGQLRYLSAINHCNLVIGNSSSGLIEVPYFKKPTINIGNRQQGRIKPFSVIDCIESSIEIKEAIHKGLSESFQVSIQNMTSPYGEGDVSSKVKNVLKQVNLEKLLVKSFHDIGGVF
ncbi:UDP-N-acetylglucosamine 2-epimerase (hydrolyzing) [Brevibacillus antibioticus]|uniref:UDP-N-acetylglucosamine 2-epimerase (Hydrolyzing) n=1 Tax=Brevibacillus antibioticus TaxID=2570228 RepID=A0A4U2YCQ9_9BACL|nr:UDP-N-acetylglucosamine 2-epimerase [Brevibacillus antibioticus]TKI58588.1 UDP-N-acetylglucosamine 2-epimerase (hydrolyzing) [Brevibacillus antibioticus]